MGFLDQDRRAHRAPHLAARCHLGRRAVRSRPAAEPGTPRSSDGSPRQRGAGHRGGGPGRYRHPRVRRPGGPDDGRAGQRALGDQPPRSGHRVTLRCVRRCLRRVGQPVHIACREGQPASPSGFIRQRSRIASIPTRPARITNSCSWPTRVECDDRSSTTSGGRHGIWRSTAAAGPPTCSTNATFVVNGSITIGSDRSTRAPMSS